MIQSNTHIYLPIQSHITHTNLLNNCTSRFLTQMANHAQNTVMFSSVKRGQNQFVKLWTDLFLVVMQIQFSINCFPLNPSRIDYVTLRFEIW